MSEFPPWVSKKTIEMYQRAQQLSKSNLKEKAGLIRQAYYHSEILEFADWLSINQDELDIRYTLLTEIETLIKV